MTDQDETFLRRALELAAKSRASGDAPFVYALSSEQLTALKPPATGQAVRLDGPALHDEARVPVDGYYT